MKSIRCLFLRILAAFAGLVVAGGWGSQEPSGDSDVISYGMTRSQLIVSGRFLNTFSGGGGATSVVSVQDVFKSPSGFTKPNHIVVCWHTAKPHGLVQFNTNTFLFFLRPHRDAEYHDVTETNHCFVLATDTNLTFLRSRLKEAK